MDLPDVILLCLEQRDCSLVEHTVNFINVARQTHYLDSSLCVFYRVSLNDFGRKLCRLCGVGDGLREL